jgi:hypothetical protein
MKTYLFFNSMSQLIAKAQLNSDMQAVELCFALVGALTWAIE